MMSKTLQLSNNKTVHYLEKGTGELLVLIHGVGMQAEAWSPQIESLSKSYRVIAVDMPGHGKSDPLPEGAQLTDFVKWAIDFISSLTSESVSLAGHSMGSLITLGVSVTRPDLIKRMAILNGVYKRTPEARAAVMTRALNLKKGKGDSDIPIHRWFGDDPAIQALALQVKTWLENVDLTGYSTAYSAFASGDDVYADRWAEVRCPVLVLTGSDDFNSTAEMAETMAQLAQKGTAVILPGERHMPNLSAPDLVNKSLQQWLAINN